MLLWSCNISLRKAKGLRNRRPGQITRVGSGRILTGALVNGADGVRISSLSEYLIAFCAVSCSTHHRRGVQQPSPKRHQRLFHIRAEGGPRFVTTIVEWFPHACQFETCPRGSIGCGSSSVCCSRSADDAGPGGRRGRRGGNRRRGRSARYLLR